MQNANETKIPKNRKDNLQLEMPQMWKEIMNDERDQNNDCKTIQTS